MATAISTDRKLSPHFTLHELVASQTATRLNIEEQFNPPPEILKNLERLAKNLLEKIRTINGDLPLMISSAYRSPRLNKAVKGVKNSQHLVGQAVDIDLGSKKANQALFNKIKKSDLEFDQLLNEFDYSWVHISLKESENRKQVLNIVK